jgi:hypothetical protein
MHPPDRITAATARSGLLRWPLLPARSSKRKRPGSSAMNQPEQQFPDQQAILEHLRGVGADLRYWYQSAETKAQLVLTVNGIFLTFLTASVLASRDEAAQATAVFGPETWAFLAAMSLCLALAILSAVTCVASRGLGRKKFRELLEHHGLDPDKAETYAPELTAFFYPLSVLKADHLVERMLTADQEFMVRALASIIVGISPNIVAKHRWVNRAFILTGLTLGFFLCTGISYLLRVHMAAAPAAR